MIRLDIHKHATQLQVLYSTGQGAATLCFTQTAYTIVWSSFGLRFEAHVKRCQQ